MKKRLTKDKIMGASTYILVTAAFLILQLLMSQGKLSSTMKGFLVPACAYIVLAISLNLLVGICGELGADTSLTKEFLAMGVDELSISPGSILPIRKIILETDTENR